MLSENQIKSIYDRHFKMLVSFAKKYVSESEIAQDLVQDVFVNLLTKESIILPDDPKGFLLAATKNKCLDYLKTRSIRIRHHEEISKLSSESDFQDKVELSELEGLIYKTVQGLPDRCREVFKSSRFDGKSNSRIAEELDISVRTVETQISKALKALRLALGEMKSVLWSVIW